MNLTESQKQFLLSTFFESDKYPGSRSIGDKLLTDGKVIVAGDKCIWIGRIGNFIQTKETTEAIGCIEYNFDLDTFLSSNWFKEMKDLHIKELSEEVDVLKTKLENKKTNLNELNLL